MTLFDYNASILPEITLVGSDCRDVPRRNINRTSEDYIYYLVTEGEMFFCEDGAEYRLSKGDEYTYQFTIGTKSADFVWINIYADTKAHANDAVNDVITFLKNAV